MGGQPHASAASTPGKDPVAIVQEDNTTIYIVSQEESSIFWEVIVSVILSKNVYMNMCPILNGFRDRGI